MDGPTLAEVARRVDDVVSRFDRVITAFETQYVRFDVFVGFKEQQGHVREVLEERLARLESRQEWLVRTIGAVVIAAVLGLVFAAGQVK